MDENVLLDWKESHADVYSKFKQDLEEQLLKPYHQTILDLGDGYAESLQSVIANLYAVSSEYGLDPTDKKQRRMAAAYLLEKISWTGISSDFKISLTVSRTQQLCDAMTVSKDLMANLFLAAGGRGGISSGGGGSNGELTNWDGTKKKTGWGM